jgi:hypothetical protein
MLAMASFDDELVYCVCILQQHLVNRDNERLVTCQRPTMSLSHTMMVLLVNVGVDVTDNNEEFNAHTTLPPTMIINNKQVKLRMKETDTKTLP